MYRRVKCFKNSLFCHLGADPDTISSTDTEDDSTEEEDNVSESGSTEGSVGESHTSEPVVDGSQSQRIDSTSLQEDQYRLVLNSG